jgi:hypothetical protein
LSVIGEPSADALVVITYGFALVPEPDVVWLVGSHGL